MAAEMKFSDHGTSIGTGIVYWDQLISLLQT